MMATDSQPPQVQQTRAAPGSPVRPSAASVSDARPLQKLPRSVQHSGPPTSSALQDVPAEAVEDQAALLIAAHLAVGADRADVLGPVAQFVGEPEGDVEGPVLADPQAQTDHRDVQPGHHDAQHVRQGVHVQHALAVEAVQHLALQGAAPPGPSPHDGVGQRVRQPAPASPAP